MPKLPSLLRLSTLMIAISGLSGCFLGDHWPEAMTSSGRLAEPSGQPVCLGISSDTLIPASAIGLPTKGAKVTSAEVVAASGSGATAMGAYCKVNADILPVDAQAPSIKLTLNLPVNYNQKGLMLGGGGYNGTIPASNGNIPAGPLNVPVPLAKGYATFSSDSGHQAGALVSQDGSFGVNDEAAKNFSGDALKKTRDVSVYLIEQHYKAGKPSKMYFIGGSTGGREALAVAQRWPEDWDGVIALYPAWNAASLDLQFGRITRALAAEGAHLDQNKRKLVYDAAMQACDGLDGVKDGLISNVKACNARFNPSTATLNGKPLRCPNGEGSIDDACLNDAQINALKVYNTPISFSYKLGSGETQYPGFNVWGADLGMAGTNPLQSRVSFLAMNMGQPTNPMPNNAPYMSIFWDQWVRFFVTKDPSFNALSLDPQHPGKWQARIQALTALQDVNKTDLSAFNARGGKLLIAHGTADVLVSTRATEQYVDRLATTMGKDKVKQFVRYYEIPGYGHALSTVYNAAWDSLSTLENWVEKAQVPENQIVADATGVPGRTRPLCEYPTWPKYKGSGDVNQAASFECVTR